MLGSRKTKDINLIPESERVVSIGSAFPVLFILGLVIIGCTVLGGIVFSLKLGAQAEAQKLDANLEEKNQEWQEVASSAASLSSIKNKITAYESFKTQYPSPNIYIETIKKFLPSNVILVALDLDNKGSSSMQVKVNEAAVAYQLVEVLNKEKSFSNVKLVSVNKPSEEEGYSVNLTFEVSK